MSQKIEEQIAEKEAELAKMKYNKATQAHFGVLKARISQLRSELVDRAASSKRSGSGFSIKKQGDATVILLGFPSVGKSTLLNAITNKESKVGAYDFTTLDAVPGMINFDGRYKDAMIQILDLPGIISGGAAGRGRGREIFSAVRNADLIIIMLDATRGGIEHYNTILDELQKANIRIDQKKPNISIRKKDFGGINVTGFRSNTSKEEIKAVMREYRISNAEVFLHDRNLTLDQIIDFIAGNRIYTPSFVIINKIDLASENMINELSKNIDQPILEISADKKIGLETLKEMILDGVNIMRVYLHKQGEVNPDMETPLIMKRGATVDDVCRKIHKRFKDDFRYGILTGPSAKFPKQKVGLSHELQDSDILKLILHR